MKKYWQIFIMAWGNLLEYRVDFIWRIAGSIINTLVLMAFWTSILSSGLGNKNYTVYTLSIYYLVIGFTNIFVSFQGQQAAHEICDGSLSAELMKPYTFFVKYFLRPFPERLIALLVFIVFLKIINFSLDPVTFILWILTLFAGLILYFFSFLAINGLAFWFSRVHGFGALFLNLGGLLSGYLIPLDMLPLAWANFAKYLPFQFLAYVPAKTLLGEYSNWQITQRIILALAWAAFFALIDRIVWNKGLRSYDSSGR